MKSALTKRFGLSRLWRSMTELPASVALARITHRRSIGQYVTLSLSRGRLHAPQLPQTARLHSFPFQRCMFRSNAC
jgi:hypothetical protein